MITEQIIRAYAALRARKLAMTGAQEFVFTQAVVQKWTAGDQAETAMKRAAEEVVG